MSILENKEAIRKEVSSWNREQLEAYQWGRLKSSYQHAIDQNAFYRSRWNGGVSLQTWSDWDELPTTSKSELIDATDPMGRSLNHTWPIDRYQRFHRTSGTMGRPLVVQDTPEDWEWWLQTWQYVLDAAHVRSTDRVFMAFSFGPFIGFWSAHDACLERGALVIPGGGMSTIGRLDLIRTSESTVICCTPSYALHLAEIATQQGIDLRSTSVRQLIVAGEPGGSSAQIRSRIEHAWDAQVVDHAGGTEVGPWGVGTPEGDGLYVIETEFLAEFLPIGPDQIGTNPSGVSRSIPTGLSELVLTPLARFGCPLFRYRTGDLVQPVLDHRHPFVRLQGGVLGRVDDMMIIRGVNVFPSSLESILLSFPEVTEFRIIASKEGELDQLEIEVEDPLQNPERIAERIHVKLGLRTNVRTVPQGSLPRQEGKARRFIDMRNLSRV